MRYDFEVGFHHTRGAEFGTGFYRQFAADHFAVYTCLRFDVEDFSHLNFTVKPSFDVGILANDVAFDDSRRSNDNLSIGLKIANQFAVEPKIGMRKDVALDSRTFYDPVGFTQQVGV